MARWESGGRERLQQAALDLFADRGFDTTTVADIAETAGLTERTFFRHFSDKREVLFYGQELFEQAFLDGLAASDASDPMQLVKAAIRSAGEFFGPERRAWSRKRQDVIDAHLPLQERELLKMAKLTTAIANALIDRGAGRTTALLAAESGVAIFRTSFAIWISRSEKRTFEQIQDDVHDQWVALR